MQLYAHICIIWVYMHIGIYRYRETYLNQPIIKLTLSGPFKGFTDLEYRCNGILWEIIWNRNKVIIHYREWSICGDGWFEIFYCTHTHIYIYIYIYICTVTVVDPHIYIYT